MKLVKSFMLVELESRLTNNWTAKNTLFEMYMSLVKYIGRLQQRMEMKTLMQLLRE